MSGVLQSGAVTPGHKAVWTTDGVIQDGGPIPASEKVLAAIFGANFNTTTDQPLLIPPPITAFRLNSIIVTNASVPLTTAAGGLYTAPSKGGSAIVAAGQTYVSLTSPSLLTTATLTSFANSARFSVNNLGYLLNAYNQNSLALYLSLTTPQGVPATADVYIVGTDLTP